MSIRRSGKIRRGIATLFVALLGSTLMSAGPAHADYNNPTSAADCNIHSRQYPFAGRKAEIDARISQCLAAPNRGRWINVPVCAYPGSERCAPLETQRCRLESQMRAVREMCMAKLQAHQAKERAQRLAEEQREREIRHAEAQAMADRREFRNDAIRNAVNPADIERGPGGWLAQALNAGNVAAGRFSGLPLTRAGALHLSAALSAEGLHIAQAIQDTTLERFREAMAQHAKNNPSFEGNFGQPTPGRLQALDEKLDQLLALEAQLKQTAAMVEHNLPVGGESAVVGEDAERLTQIAQAMADGKLKGSLFDTPAADAVALIEKWEEAERERQIRQEGASDVLNGVSDAAMRDRRRDARRTVSALVTKDQQRREAVARAEKRKRDEEARKKAAAVATKSKKRAPSARKPSSNLSCVQIVDEGRFLKIRNFCNFSVRLRAGGKSCSDPKDGYLSAYTGGGYSHTEVWKPCRYSISR